MTHERAIKTIKIAKADVEWNYPMEYQEAFDIAIDCIKKLVDIVQCKDCEMWDEHHKITGLSGKSKIVGACNLTHWLCGAEGHCMYGRRKEVE